MAVRQRAMQVEDREARCRAILDAAERLLAVDPDRVASMADVAEEAGLAKGTIYLYFGSKDELLLALHERNVEPFFRELIARLGVEAPVAVDDLQALIAKHMLASPVFLPLAAHCYGARAHHLPTDAWHAFRERIAERLARAGAGLQRHFPELGAGGGLALLRHSYALLLGLWQMSAERRDNGNGSPSMRAGAPDLPFAVDLERALRSLWTGRLGPSASAHRP